MTASRHARLSRSARAAGLVSLLLALAPGGTAQAARGHGPGHALGHSAGRRARGHAPVGRLRLQTFLLASAPDSLVDLKAHVGSIGVVYPTYFNCQISSGAIVGADVPTITGYAAGQKIAVMPRINCQDGATVHTVLTEPVARAAALARLAAIAGDPLYRGLCLDFENDGASDREALNSFVAALARGLHAQGKRLTVVVDGVGGENPTIATGFYDDRTIGSLADTVFVLAWGAHWEGSEPGPIAPLSYVAAVVRYVTSLPNSSRFVLGAPMYGLDWPEGGGPTSPATAYQYSAIVALARSVGAKLARDPASGELTFTYTSAAGVEHRVWYMDSRAVLDMLRIARADGLAVGLWRLGREDQALWSSSVLTE